MGKIRQILTVPGVVIVGAISFWKWLHLDDNDIGPANIQDKARLVDGFGWFGDGMRAHWETYFDHRSDHNKKNLGSEWVRLDPQRAYKLGAFWIVCDWILITLLVIACLGLALL